MSGEGAVRASAVRARVEVVAQSAAHLVLQLVVIVSTGYATTADTAAALAMVTLLAVCAQRRGHLATIGGEDGVGRVGVAIVVAGLLVLFHSPLSTTVDDEEGHGTDEEEADTDGDTDNGTGG